MISQCREISIDTNKEFFFLEITTNKYIANHLHSQINHGVVTCGFIKYIEMIFHLVGPSSSESDACERKRHIDKMR